MYQWGPKKNHEGNAICFCKTSEFVKDESQIIITVLIRYYLVD